MTSWFVVVVVLVVRDDSPSSRSRINGTPTKSNGQFAFWPSCVRTSNASAGPTLSRQSPTGTCKVRALSRTRTRRTRCVASIVYAKRTKSGGSMLSWSCSFEVGDGIALAAGSRTICLIARNSTGEHGRRTLEQMQGLPASGAVHQPVPRRSSCQRTGGLSCKFYK